MPTSASAARGSAAGFRQAAKRLLSPALRIGPIKGLRNAANYFSRKLPVNVWKLCDWRHYPAKVARALIGCRAWEGGKEAIRVAGQRFSFVITSFVVLPH